MKFEKGNQLQSLEDISRSNLSRSPVIPPSMVLRAQKGDDFALNEVVLSASRIVRAVARRYSWKDLSELHDYEQEGRIGILKAIDAYDGVHAWVPHAKKHITWAIQEAFQKPDLQGIAPRYRSKWIAYVDEVDKSATTMSVPDAIHEVALQNGVSLPHLQRAYFVLKHGELERLDRPVSESDAPLHYMVPDTMARADILPREYDHRLREALINAIDSVSVGQKQKQERNRAIIKLYYGLDRNQGMRTFEEVGEMFKITRQRAEQIVNAYVTTLSSNTTQERLEPLYDMFLHRQNVHDVA